MCSPSLVIVVLACAPHRPTRSPRRRQGRCYTTVQGCGRRVCDAVRRPAVRHGAGGTCGSSAGAAGRGYAPDGSRSEEHTSELQSLMRISYAVFCLKKKKKKEKTHKV